MKISTMPEKFLGYVDNKKDGNALRISIVRRRKTKRLVVERGLFIRKRLWASTHGRVSLTAPELAAVLLVVNKDAVFMNMLDRRLQEVSRANHC